MKLKESYTLEELCSNLTITLTKFCQMAGITEGTLIRLRQGHSGRQNTINSILATFSQIYGIEFSRENVTGLTLQEKPHQKGKKQPVLPSEVQTPKVAKEKAPTRTYKPRDTALPDGAILAIDFARNHNVKRETFRDHMMTGLGPGLIHGDDIPEDGSVQVKDYVRSEERNKRVRKDGTIEKERYLTEQQQNSALEFWNRHSVDYSECDQAGCYCHTLKQENN